MARKTKKRSVLKTIVTIFFLLLLAAFIAGYAFTAKYMKDYFPRFDAPDPSLTAAYGYDHYEADYPRQEVSFRSGDNLLKGYIYGLNNDKGVIVFAHGLGASHASYFPTITALVDRGWRVFAYDATGSYTSEGKSTVGLAQSVIDLDRAVTFVENNSVFANMPIFVMGHSWGGYASAAVLNMDHDIKGCVSMSGYSTPMAELCETADDLFSDKSVLVYPFMWVYNKVHAGRFASYSAVDGLNKSGIPALIIHGDNDETVKYYGAAIIANQGRINNPNVQYYTFETEGKDTHNGFFYTSEYLDHYNNDLKAKSDELDSRNDVTDEELAEYIAMVDKEKYNALNPDLIDMIDEFLEPLVGAPVETHEQETAPETEPAETTAPETEAAEEETSEEAASEEAPAEEAETAAESAE